MSEPNPEKGTFTAKSSLRPVPPAVREIAECLKTLERSLSNAYHVLEQLTVGARPDCLDLAERKLLHEWRVQLELRRERLSELEEQWRARQGLSPRS